MRKCENWDVSVTLLTEWPVSTISSTPYQLWNHCIDREETHQYLTFFSIRFVWPILSLLYFTVQRSCHNACLYWNNVYKSAQRRLILPTVYARVLADIMGFRVCPAAHHTRTICPSIENLFAKLKHMDVRRACIVQYLSVRVQMFHTRQDVYMG